MKTLDSIRTQDIPTIGGLVNIAREGADFYGQQAKVVPDKGLSKLLSEMADARQRFVQDATKSISGKDSVQLDTPQDAPIVSTWKGLYSDLAPSMSDKNLGFVPVLDGSESRLLAAFDKAGADAALPAEIKQAVVSYLPAMRKHQTILTTEDGRGPHDRCGSDGATDSIQQCNEQRPCRGVARQRRTITTSLTPTELQLLVVRRSQESSNPMINDISSIAQSTCK
ncbi:MAG: hypothetical protein HC938_14420 [Nitrospira sp.]|nr:hypothetical protein [Nitrospira sp.]